MTYDGARQRFVMCGGLGAEGHLSYCWTWSGARWRPLSEGDGSEPKGRRDFAFVFDGGLNRLVLFGGRGSGGLLMDVWEFDSTKYT